MSLIARIDFLKEELQKEKKKGHLIGLVPTMGYLHEGHLSLIRRAKQENDIVVVSIFVNPTQFAPNEDYESYPRDIERDYEMAREAGADIIFNPSVQEMYPAGASTFVVVEGDITQKLCGGSRPSHFKGVTTVVAMLLNLVLPDFAYFGQKDAQQAIVLKKMARDLHIATKLIVCPIVRENDGLALSSRNVYLNEIERNQALILSRTLFEAQAKVYEGKTKVEELKEFMIANIKTMDLAEIDYVEILDADTLEEIETIENNALAALAVKFGKTRLIDNVILQRGE